jgi:hypothetical protein
MQAMINPDAPVQHVIGWNGSKPIMETYPNSATVCEVQAITFPIALPLYWVECSDNILAYQFWYSLTTQQFSLIENVIPPQPVSTGTQTL